MLFKKSFSSLKIRDYRLFWLGQLISLSGTWMQSVAQSWLVYELTGSPFYLGLVAASGTLPILLFTLAGGIVADRFRKRNLLLFTQALSIIPAFLLGLLTDLHIIEVWQVAVLAGILGTINAFDIPARQSFMSELVGKEHLTNAIALNSAAFHGARMIGPVFAGIAIARIGLPACFYLNAISFIAVIIALSMIKTMGEKHETSAGITKSLIEGLQFVKKQSDIFRLIIMITIFSLIAMPFITLLPVFAGEIFNKGAEGFGLLVGATGAGALSAALFLAFKGDIGNKTKFIAFSAFCISMTAAADGVSTKIVGPVILNPPVNINILAHVETRGLLLISCLVGEELFKLSESSVTLPYLNLLIYCLNPPLPIPPLYIINYRILYKAVV